MLNSVYLRVCRILWSIFSQTQPLSDEYVPLVIFCTLRESSKFDVNVSCLSQRRCSFNLSSISELATTPRCDFDPFETCISSFWPKSSSRRKLEKWDKTQFYVLQTCEIPLVSYSGIHCCTCELWPISRGLPCWIVAFCYLKL